MAVGLVVCLAAMIALAKFTLLSFQGDPFRLVLKPNGGHTLVQFAQPDRKLASPEFRVDLIVNSPQVIDLQSDEVSVPGLEIEFSDTTMLPGRFKIRIGSTLFDVMQRGIIVDGKEYDWGE